tara:strand:+ start:12639 stop:12968 length:330 start_codon:yes stop_codon:yes gene_type:complete
VKLLTKRILEQTSELLEDDGRDDHKRNVTAKFFDPTGSFTWYLLEIDKDSKDLCFGLVTSQYEPNGELGYFRISELESIEGPFGIGIERDKFFETTSLDEIKEKVGYPY